MSLQLKAILDKIDDVEDRNALKFQSEQINAQLEKIRNQELGISSVKEIQLSILLQNVNLNKFTNEELIFLSTLKLDYFGTRAFPAHSSKVLSKGIPLHDTGSSRLYFLINSEDLISTSINLTFAGLNSYQPVSLKDLIASLYLLGA